MTISEVSKTYGLSVETLRYYERAGLIRGVPRTASGLRSYNETNCKTIEFIKCMRAAGISIEILGEYIDLLEQGDATMTARKNLLIEQRKVLQARQEELAATIARLDFKIENYEAIMAGKHIPMPQCAAQPEADSVVKPA